MFEQSKRIDANLSYGNLTARLAASPSDLKAVARLRYEVYIAEQGKPYAEADHEQRLLTDSLDVDGHTIVVEVDGKLVGTVRTNFFANQATFDFYAAMFDVNRLQDALPQQVTVCSRLAVLPEYRFSTARQDSE
jgi:predicted GNAT family N-acyltransferase